MLGQFTENYLPWAGPHAEAREECEEEGAAETTCDELTTTPIPNRIEVEPGKKGGVGGRCFKI